LKLFANSGVFMPQQELPTMKLQFAIILAATVGISALAQDQKPAMPAGTLPPDSTKTGVTFATDIKPIFDASCVKCHSGPKAKAGLHLDTLEGTLKGGKGGKDKILKPGNSAGSDVVKMVAHVGDPQGWMPPAKNKAGIKPLTAEQVGLIRAWIDQGAK
jgi:cytochrome c551/c552